VNTKSELARGVLAVLVLAAGACDHGGAADAAGSDSSRDASRDATRYDAGIARESRVDGPGVVDARVEGDRDRGQQTPDLGKPPDLGIVLDPGTGSLAAVPGTVVYSRGSPWTHLFGPDRIYTTSPSIVVLPTGEYLLAFNLFGDSLSPAADVSGTTYLYRSADKGLTWLNLTPSPMMGMKRGSLFVLGNSVFLVGYTAAPGQIVILESTDKGTSWTVPSDAKHGLLSTGTFGGTPHVPALHGGRLWTAVSGKRVMSASLSKPLLEKASWAGPSASADTSTSPLGSGLILSEAQIVASPLTGVVVMPKTDGLAFTALIRATGDSTVADPADADWVALPGADKKFGAAYDPVSKRFYVLSNPVLPAHAGYPGLTPQLIRNTAAMLSSRDLLHWDVEQLFLYSPHLTHEAFQYFSFGYDGDDLVIASRTAFDIGGNKPPRGHDSNLITFHRIASFRGAVPRHFIMKSGSSVLRYEQTQHAAAPLGSFTLGTVFDGSALGPVIGMAPGSSGEVFVKEQSGRILRFDALGNFLEIAASAPAPLQAGPFFIDPPPLGERAWIKSGSGAWDALESWFYWGRPDTSYEVANLGSAIAAPATLAVDRKYSLRGLRFRSAHRYTLAGSGELTLEAEKGAGLIDVQQGSHHVGVAIRLGAETHASARGGAALQWNGSVDLNGQPLRVKGAGAFTVNGPFAMKGGRLVLDGLSPLTFTAAATTKLDGELVFQPDASLPLSPGAVFKVLGGASNLGGTFAKVVLPVLVLGTWDTSALYSQGTLRIVP
jgi:hypothetical protein